METFAGVVVAVAATAAAIGFLATWPPVRWVFRRLVTEPYTAWYARQVTEIVRAEVPAIVHEALGSRPLTNGWGTRTLQAVAEAVGAPVDPPGTADGEPYPHSEANPDQKEGTTDA
jgi:hypothetical protein